jgi:hypothetical protein
MRNEVWDFVFCLAGISNFLREVLFSLMILYVIGTVVFICQCNVTVLLLRSSGRGNEGIINVSMFFAHPGHREIDLLLATHARTLKSSRQQHDTTSSHHYTSWDLISPNLIQITPSVSMKRVCFLWHAKLTFCNIWNALLSISKPAPNYCLIFLWLMLSRPINPLFIGSSHAHTQLTAWLHLAWFASLFEVQ